jgi:DNA-binding transcriptional regulator PaaX
LRGFDEDRDFSLAATFWRRMEAERWVKRKGRGAAAEFTITEKGRQRCAEADPTVDWARRWDSRWRLVTFDVPEHRRKERKALWRELRARRLGYLQQSVWVWPHDIEPILREIIQAQGIPECFAGFECARLFLCTNQEIVLAAWDFKTLKRTHETYLKQVAVLTQKLRGAPDLTSLARHVRDERLAHAHAIESDPLLPKALWPRGYRGEAVLRAHREARAVLRQRLPQLI